MSVSYFLSQDARQSFFLRHIYKSYLNALIKLGPRLNLSPVCETRP